MEEVIEEVLSFHTKQENKYCKLFHVFKKLTNKGVQNNLQNNLLQNKIT
jgi:hypothetical protein